MQQVVFFDCAYLEMERRRGSGQPRRDIAVVSGFSIMLEPSKFEVVFKNHFYKKRRVTIAPRNVTFQALQCHGTSLAPSVEGSALVSRMEQLFSFGRPAVRNRTDRDGCGLRCTAGWLAIELGALSKGVGRRAEPGPEARGLGLRPGARDPGLGPANALTSLLILNPLSKPTLEPPFGPGLWAPKASD